jgi:hypothetical protein
VIRATQIRAVLGVARVGFLVLGCITASAQQHQRAVNSNIVRVSMRGIMYHFTDEIGANIRFLEGDLEPTTRGHIPVFDDDRSFVISIRSAEIAVTLDSLAKVMNQYVFAAADAPLKDISLEAQKDSIKIRGKLHSKGDVPFETQGTLEPTPSGEIRIRMQKVRAAHLPVKALMDLLGIKLENVVNTKKLQGIRTQGDDLILSPAIFPPPKIKGKITALRIESDSIVQVYGTGKPSGDNEPVENHMSYKGAQLKFGKLTMNDTDLVLIDMDPGDPFDFKLSRYKDQLVAGYSKTTPTFGLRVYMRDYNKLKSEPARAAVRDH